MHLLVREVPETLKRALDARARRQRRSTAAEILVLLAWAVEAMPEQEIPSAARKEAARA